MQKSIAKFPLYSIANPQSIVFFGASNNFGTMGTIFLSSVREIGFEGPVYPVHPKEDLVQSLKAFRSVADLPETPDLAVIVLPTRLVVETLKECGRKGIRNAVVVSGGFKEVGGHGPEMEQELAEAAAEYGLCLLGPNCLGVSNPHHKLNTTPFPYLGAPGFIGMASQSGSFITQMYNYLARLGLGFSTAFSTGNEAVVDLVDCLEYLGTCPKTKVIALYIEGIKRGRAFIETAKSISPHKPIVAMYVGGSETGRQAGFSHTGAIAGPDVLYDGMFRQGGIIRARNLTELFDFCWVLGTLPPPKGRRVAILTDSGGPGAAAADACGRAGLDAPAFSSETLEGLAPLVPHTGSINNPVDLTFHRNHMDYYTEIPKLLLRDDNTDSLMMYFLTPVEFFKRGLEHMGVPKEQHVEMITKMINDQYQPVGRLLENQDKPIVGYTWRSFEEQTIRTLLDLGLPVFPDPERAARALAAMAQYSKIRDKIP